MTGILLSDLTAEKNKNVLRMTTRSVQENNKIFEDYAFWRGEPTTSARRMGRVKLSLHA